MKTYKIVRLAGAHSPAVINLYLNTPQLNCASYEQQQQALFANAIMYSDTFSREMRKLGVSAEEIIYDIEPLQKAWAQEHKIRIRTDQWRYEIVLAQLAHIQPDVVFFQDIHSLPYELRSTLKQQIPSIKKLVIFRGYPGIDNKLIKELSLADLLLVGSPILLHKGRQNGLTPHLVYHSFDPSILEKLSPVDPEKMIDFSFIGSSGYGYQHGHQDRYWMLHSLLEQTDIALWVDEPGANKPSKIPLRSQLAHFIKTALSCCNPQILEKINKSLPSSKFRKLIAEVIEQKLILSDTLPKRPLCEIFPHRCFQPLFGLEMFRKIQESKVVLNKHSNPARGTVDNIRLFQATGVGTCLLTDTGNNMSDLFEEDREIVTYSSTEECVEKARYLLKNDALRKRIAEAGQQRTLKDHNSAKRYEHINSLIQEILF